MGRPGNSLAAVIPENMMAANKITVNTDLKKPDFTFIHGFISKAQWANARTLKEVKLCAAHSLNFAIYSNDVQIGYARVVTDYVVLAYVMDIFTDQQNRNQGDARQLMESMLGSTDLKNIKVWKLGTGEAHFLYDKFGFKPLSKPGNMMERLLSDQ
jgi:GNAT superfamily N-acetyltransferase